MDSARPPGRITRLAVRSPAGFAVVATALTALLGLVPGLNALLFIAIMLPLWFIHGLGVVALGHELNGFFIPNAAGWALACGIVWAFWLLIGLNTRRHVLRQRRG